MTNCHVPVQQLLSAKTCVCACKGLGFHFLFELFENSVCDGNTFLLNPLNSLFSLGVWVVQGMGTAEHLPRDGWLGSVPRGASSGAVRAVVACNWDNWDLCQRSKVQQGIFYSQRAGWHES